ncbi:MAG: hypothetical protein ACREJ0_30510 [Geminicoccaceae bacterium]
MNIKDPATRAMARERLREVRRGETAKSRRLADRLDEIADHCAALPVLRDRSVDEILGYADRDSLIPPDGPQS